MTNYPLTGKATDRFFDEWGFIINGKEDPDGGYYGWERWQLNSIRRKEMGKGVSGYKKRHKTRIWSVIESGECACLWIVAGEKHVNVVHFMVSTKHWEDENTEWLDYHCPECQKKEEE